MKDKEAATAIKILIDNYLNQLELYQKVLDLAREQLAVAQERQPALVEEILQRKLGLLEAVDRLKLTIAEEKVRIIQECKIEELTISALSLVLPEPAQQLQEVFARLAEVLVEITEAESLNEQILSQGVQGLPRKSRSFREISSAYQAAKPK